MAERVIRMRDLAASLITAGGTVVPAGTGVTALGLELIALTGPVPRDDGFWDLRLRQPRPSRATWISNLGWFARLRRARRRRAGVMPHRLTLRWTPTQLDAAVDGDPVAHIDLTAERT